MGYAVRLMLRICRYILILRLIVCVVTHFRAFCLRTRILHFVVTSMIR